MIGCWGKCLYSLHRRSEAVRYELYPVFALLDFLDLVPEDRGKGLMGVSSSQP